ncbi:SAV_915 family protein [Streptosporangium lutulentum]
MPVRSAGGVLGLRLFRTPAGDRTAVAFTSRDRLTKVLGGDQEWTWLCGRALRGMVEDLGGVGVVVDPAGTVESRDHHLRAA